MPYIDRDIALKLLERNSITKHITFSDGVSIYDTIANIPTADVVPKSEVAREIFEEIDDFIIASGIFEGYYGYPVIAWNEKGYEELKKKYTEEQT